MGMAVHPIKNVVEWNLIHPYTMIIAARMQAAIVLQHLIDGYCDFLSELRSFPISGDHHLHCHLQTE